MTLDSLPASEDHAPTGGYSSITEIHTSPCRIHTALGADNSPASVGAFISFAHSGRIVAAEAPAQSTDPVAVAGGRGGFPGGNTPYAPGALTECATFQAEPGANQWTR